MHMDATITHPGTPNERLPRAGSVAVPFAAVVLAMLPAVLDQTILSTALPTIAVDLGHLTDVSWVVSAYVVAAAATTPLWGKLGDRHGRKRLIELALVLFAASSALCGVAPNITVLVFVRAVQGAAAGGLMTLAMAAVGDLVAPRERARYQGYIAAVFAVATVAGPLLGGVLVDNAGWRFIFYVNLPVSVAALVVLDRRFPAAALGSPRQRLDGSAAALLAAATSAFMLICIWGGARYAWTSRPIAGLVAGLALLVGALVVCERRASDPIVPVKLLRTRPVAVASAALFLTTAALFAVNVFVPLFLETTTGATPTQAGLLLVPMMVGIAVSTNLAGREIARTGRYRRYPIVGLALMTAALALLAGVASHPDRASVGVGLALFGLGFGMVGQVMIVAVQNSVEQRQLGTAMATTSFFRALGGATSAAVLGAIFVSRAGTAAADSTGLHTVTPAARADIIGAVQTVFVAGTVLAAAALAVALLLRETPLRER
jgi:EmrB/QacA subfamily drug resistance transporter